MPSAEPIAAAPARGLERAAWCVARARRARLLVDAAEYFGVLRETMKRARRRIIIVGWDIDSRAPLTGEPGDPGDGMPRELGAFLAELTVRQPDIEIRLLLWDYSMLYALEREPLPRLQLDWTSPPQITLCMDGTLPIGASHHEKLVIVDDRVAFCGGLDLTIRRWDTPAHDPENSGRVDPKGQPYAPFHDLQMMVDGDAAIALSEVARARWEGATGVALEPVVADTDPWPRNLEPGLQEVDVAIARTRPRYNGAPEIRECEAVLRAAIAEAERFIYIENQFLTSDAVGDALIARMHQQPDLEVLAVVPGEHYGWLEQTAMRAGQARLMARFRQAGLAGRIRLVVPAVDGPTGTARVKVHSKLMIVDDRTLKIGSSNLNNRSMGLDTECDLIVLARDAERRRAVQGIRDSLIAEHTGAGIEEVAAAMGTSGSIVEAITALGDGRRRLEPVEDDPALGSTLPEPVATLADPDRPWPEAISFDSLRPPRSIQYLVRRWIRRWPVAAVVVVAFALVLAWRYSPLEEWTRIEHLVEPMRMIADSQWAPLATIGVYLAGGLTLFPITVLIAVTAMVFGPWEGVLYSLLGSVAGALVGYGLGRRAGRRAPSIWKVGDGRVARLIRVFSGNGIIGIASLRMLPLAPFMLINLAAGAARVPFIDFAIGSALGLGPGIIAFNLMGVQLEAVLTDGRPQDVGILLGLLAAWLALSVLLQRLINRRIGTMGERAG